MPRLSQPLVEKITFSSARATNGLAAAVSSALPTHAPRPTSDRLDEDDGDDGDTFDGTREGGADRVVATAAAPEHSNKPQKGVIRFSLNR